MFGFQTIFVLFFIPLFGYQIYSIANVFVELQEVRSIFIHIILLLRLLVS